jgi:hypothetical protein
METRVKYVSIKFCNCFKMDSSLGSKQNENVKIFFHFIMMSISKLTVKSLEILLVALWKLVITKAISYVISSQ